VDRSVEEPGRPDGEEAVPTVSRVKGINNRHIGPGRESDRPIVAGKRLTTVERRGLTGNMPK